MASLGDTIRAARKQKRISGTAFGAALNPRVTPATVSHWESGTDLPQRTRLDQIAAVLGLNPVELRALHDRESQQRAVIPGFPTAVAGEVKPAIDVQPHVRNRADPASDLPVYATTPAGGLGRGFYMSSQPSHKVGRPVKLEGREDVFGFYVCTADMESKYEVGDFEVAELHRQPRARDYVLVELKPEEGEALRPFLLKRLVEVDLAAGNVRLEQLNPKKRLTIPLSKIVRLYRVLQTEDLC